MGAGLFFDVKAFLWLLTWLSTLISMRVDTLLCGKAREP